MRAPVDGRRLGSLAHVLVGECLQDGVRGPSPVELLARAGRHAMTNDPSTSHRQAAKQALLTTASVYFRWFVPPPDWVFIGAEVAAGGCRFDLVWETEAGVVVDELKTGTWVSVIEDQDLDAQVLRLLRAGEAKYAKSFVGVRVIILNAPRRSYLARPSGVREPLL